MKKKIVILGGGVSALTTAYGLTSAPQWQDQYEITIYQLGWRLGGKGASGRNAQKEQRIEEHGLHVWGGFYENAFSMMRQCYGELARQPNQPLATWQDAFKPSQLVTWTEEVQGQWKDWNNYFPNNDQLPGDGTPMPDLWQCVIRILEWMFEVLLDPQNPLQSLPPEAPIATLKLPDWVQASGNFSAAPPSLNHPAHPWLTKLVTNLSHPLNLAQSLSENPSEHPAQSHLALTWLLKHTHTEVKSRLASELPDNVRRFLIILDLGLAEVIGILSDGVLFKGINCLDQWDFAEWLAQSGASPESVSSGLVRGVYDFIFAYPKGDTTQPSLGAGTGLRCVIRLLCWYKGSIFWKMQAGMGDTVFAPLYLVLQKRGVTFKFFHKITNLGVTEDGLEINSITTEQQVDLKNGNYDPLVDVLGLPCWPSEPLYDQIVQGEQLQQEKIDLESSWTPWKSVGQSTLIKGVDFDLVVLATSLAPLTEITSELAAKNRRWQQMLQNLATVQTQALQLWMKPSLASLGWSAGPSVLTAYLHPMDTWADMSQVLPREIWHPGEEPQSLAYFCGVLPDADPIPPYSDHQFPAEQKELVKTKSQDWLPALAFLWPNSFNQNQFNWDLLVDPQSEVGPQRFNSQYWRANINPAERYVLSLPKTLESRLQAGDSGFTNLFLAGDWILNGLNFGCIESCVMGGLEASRAICGYPTTIVGETD